MNELDNEYRNEFNVFERSGFLKENKFIRSIEAYRTPEHAFNVCEAVARSLSSSWSWLNVSQSQIQEFLDLIKRRVVFIQYKNPAALFLGWLSVTDELQNAKIQKRIATVEFPPKTEKITILEITRYKRLWEGILA